MMLLKLKGWWMLIKMSYNEEIDRFHKAWVKEDEGGYMYMNAAAANCTSGAAAAARTRPVALTPVQQLSDCSSE